MDIWPYLSRNIILKIIGMVLALTLLGACGGGTGTLAINWIAPTQREDGTPLKLSEIVTYNLYYGNSPGDYQYKVDNSKVTVNSVYVPNFPVGTYYFVVTSVTTDCLESRYSEEIEIII